MRRLYELVGRTPASRVRYVDLLRAVAIGAVVSGHWLLVVVVRDGSRLRGYSALSVLDWSHWVTWLFQVMPVFFIVGGFANAASLRAHRRRGGDAVEWLLGRGRRLMPPTTVLLLVVVGVALLARLAGVDPEWTGTAAWLATVPLWFLAFYLPVVLLTPVMLGVHQWAGLAVPLVLVGAVAAGDVARLRYGMSAASQGNYLFAWAALYQVGFAWQDGRLPNRPLVSVPMMAAGLAVLLGFTVAGPYPVSMVNVPGAPVQNVAPPTLALLALATAQLGVVLLLRDRGERWLRRTRPWTTVIAVNSVVLTVFLWHMSAVVLISVALYLTGILPTPSPHSQMWLLWRIPWLALLSTALAGLVVVFGRFETRQRRPQPAIQRRLMPARLAAVLSSPRPRAVLTAAGFIATTLGLLRIATAGRADHGPFGLSTTALAVFLVGAATLRTTRSTPPPHHNVAGMP